MGLARKESIYILNNLIVILKNISDDFSVPFNNKMTADLKILEQTATKNINIEL